MNETVEAAAKSVFDALALHGLERTATVVLIGSGARNTMSERSDIDILVLDDAEHQIRLEHPGEVHLQECSRSRFLSRLEDGDDYPCWALRFGIPMRDPGGWWANQAAAELENPHWPNWRPKIGYARKRIKIASELLDVNDVDAASEELLFAASHVARALLLKHGIFPFSRPELPSQLEDIEPALACILGRLIHGNIGEVELRSVEAFLISKIGRLYSLSGSLQ